mgnify:CR=1 FL=1
MIKCITFDLDDTLWRIEPVINKADIKFHEWLNDNYPVVTEKYDVVSLRELVKNTSLGNPDIKHDLSKVRIKAYTLIKNLYGLPEDMPSKAFNFFMKYRNKVVLHHKAEDILFQLKKRYKLGTITNGNASIRKIGIQRYFDFEIKASDVGYMKPNSKIFKAAIEKAKCDPSEMLHIGDSYEKDIIGAKSVKMNYIWLNYNGDFKKDIDKKNIIKSISQIPEAIKNIG